MSGRVKQVWPTATSPGALGWLARPLTAASPPVTAVTSAQVRAVGRVVVQRRHAGARAEHEQVVAGEREAR